MSLELDKIVLLVVKNWIFSVIAGIVFVKEHDVCIDDI